MMHQKVIFESIKSKKGAKFNAIYDHINISTISVILSHWMIFGITHTHILNEIKNENLDYEMLHCFVFLIRLWYNRLDVIELNAKLFYAIKYGSLLLVHCRYLSLLFRRTEKMGLVDVNGTAHVTETGWTYFYNELNGTVCNVHELLWNQIEL